METLKDKITVMTDYPQIISQDIKNIYTIHKLPLKKYSSYNCGYIFYDGYDREHDAADQNDWDCKETLDDVTNRILKSKHNEDND